jgi:N-acetylneuraminate lyase
MKHIEGLITAPFTPFNKDGKVNLQIISDLAEFYKRNAIAGVFVCGTTGESSALTFNEKIKLFETWSEHKATNFKIIAFLGGTCVDECKQLALAAQEYNLDAVAITAPYYFKPSGLEELAAFCSEVAAAVSLPFYYYHMPSFTGAYYNMYDLLTCVDDKIPNFTGIKYTYENIMDYQRCLNYKNRKYNILWGRDEMLLSALVIGATGAVGSTYGYTAPVYLKIMEAYKKFDMETARALQLKAIEYITFLHKYGSSTGKAFMKAVGKDCGNYRLPIRNLSDAQMQQFLTELKATDFYTYCSI